MSDLTNLTEALDALKAVRVQLSAWQEAFGTSQLTHAVARLEAAEKRVKELETTFHHYHVCAHDGTDRCASCKLDLRDQVHYRTTLAAGRSDK